MKHIMHNKDGYNIKIRELVIKNIMAIPSVYATNNRA